MSNNCYLIGLPGVGKSYFGTKWANELGKDFIDLDKNVEEAAGKSISNIFKENGENFFRMIEREELLKTAFIKNSIIACGGGISNYLNNINWMNVNGCTLWVDDSIEAIKIRIRNESASRPYFRGLSNEEIASKLSSLKEKRKQNYQNCAVKWMVEDDDSTIKEQIMSKMG
jgi:shikimate kinase